MKQEEDREDGMLGGGYKSLCSLQSIRVKLRAEPGGEKGGGKWEAAERKDEGRGWHPGKCGKRAN